MSYLGGPQVETPPGVMANQKKHANVDNLDTSKWDYFTYTDLHPGPGCYVSPTWNDYEVFGETINGLNLLHARFLYLTRNVEGELGQCSLCHQGLRYVVIFKDSDGKLYSVGEQCSEFVEAKMDFKDWKVYNEIKKFSKKVNTKAGTRFLISFPAFSGFWDMKKAGEIPEWVSCSKYRGEWQVTIWAEDTAQLTDRLIELGKTKAIHWTTPDGY